MATQIKCSRCVLPENDMRRTGTVLESAIKAVEADDSQKARTILAAFLDEEEVLLSEVFSLLH